MILDIFSSRILFSLSISVYRPIEIKVRDEIRKVFRLTFKHGILFCIAHGDVGGVGFGVLGADGGLDIA